MDTWYLRYYLGNFSYITLVIGNHMLKQNTGHIVFVSSVVGKIAIPYRYYIQHTTLHFMHFPDDDKMTDDDS